MLFSKWQRTGMTCVVALMPAAAGGGGTAHRKMDAWRLYACLQKACIWWGYMSPCVSMETMIDSSCNLCRCTQSDDLFWSIWRQVVLLHLRPSPTGR